MSFSKIYSRIFWKNKPQTSTALGATNLNKMDSALDTLDDRIVTLDVSKLNITVANQRISDFELDEDTGVITITYGDGSTSTYNTALEKIVTNFSYDSENKRLVLELPDGSEEYVDLSDLVHDYNFTDSTTIAFSTSGENVSASIKNGSINGDKLETNYLANCVQASNSAEASKESASGYADNAEYDAQLSQSYAIGGTGIREGEDTDNAKYYKEQAEQIASGDTYANTVSFTSADNLSPTSFQSVALMSSGETHRSLMNKISAMFSNIRFLNNKKIDNDNIVGSGAVSINRKADTTVGTKSVAMGESNTANNYCAVAIGRDNTSSYDSSVAIGRGNTSSYGSSVAIGYSNTSVANVSVAMGRYNEANGDFSVAMGNNNKANGNFSDAIGNGNTASGGYSVAIGSVNKATYDYETALGKYNETKDIALSVGIGTSGDDRKNGLELDWSGNFTTAGDITNGNGVSIGSINQRLTNISKFNVSVSTGITSSTGTINEQHIVRNSETNFAYNFMCYLSNVSVGSNSIICTLPSSLKPSVANFIYGMYYANNQWNIAQFHIDTNGNVRQQMTATSQTWQYVRVMATVLL